MVFDERLKSKTNKFVSAHERLQKSRRSCFTKTQKKYQINFDKLKAQFEVEIELAAQEGIDFESIVHQIKIDIATHTFLQKAEYYADLLKLDCLAGYYRLEKLTDDTEELKIDEIKILERLFELYCPDQGFVIPAKTNHHLREYLDRLEPDGRYLSKKQLNLFGEWG